ncbi:hypothetical protein TCAL_00422 [Tigriopus californicus]|uniref:Mitochondrial import inner membrane translocase subunit n=1 Tax=Tigriopus californicus TaxID=6832 RepID=A0A553ND65_TIGCA|nr:hypothetical protein TCAL_00422 [Tigriopus californicus]
MEESSPSSSPNRSTTPTPPTLPVNEDQVATFRSFFQTYNRISEYCFRTCVWDFGTPSLRAREERCLNRCTSHYLQMTKEIGHVFAEGQTNLMLGGAAAPPVVEPVLGSETTSVA